MSTPPTVDCLHCIDGITPTGSPLIGPAFRECPMCQPPCPGCRGKACFPARRISRDELVARLHQRGLAVEFCHTCAGILALHRLDGQVSR